MQFFNQGNSISVNDVGNAFEIDVNTSNGWDTVYIDKDLILQLASLLQDETEESENVMGDEFERLIRG